MSVLAFHRQAISLSTEGFRKCRQQALASRDAGDIYSARYWGRCSRDYFKAARAAAQSFQSWMGGSK